MGTASPEILLGLMVVLGLTALGLYASAKAVVPQAVNTDGWVKIRRE